MTDELKMSTPMPRFMPPPPPRTLEDGSRFYDAATYGLIFGYRPLVLDVRVPAVEEPPPLVLWIHGGGWMMGDRRYPPPTFTERQIQDAVVGAGLAYATIDYRLSREAKFPAQLHDAKAAVRYVRAHARDFGIDATLIGVWGESAGGHLVAMLGVTGDNPHLEGDVGITGPSSAVNAVVDWYGAHDLAAIPEIDTSAMPDDPELKDPMGLVLGAPASERPDLAAAASPLSYVGAASPPFLLVHGTSDQLVPFDQSERLAAALREARVDVELQPVDGADHIFLGVAVEPIIERSVQFLAQRLSGQSRHARTAAGIGAAEPAPA